VYIARPWRPALAKQVLVITVTDLELRAGARTGCGATLGWPPATGSVLVARNGAGKTTTMRVLAVVGALRRRGERDQRRRYLRRTARG